MTPSKPGLSSFNLRNLAMLFMLIDHIGTSLFPDLLWLRFIGRLAFPIFAFLIVEGYHHTRNFTKYLGRLLALALISDIPYGLLTQGTWTYTPFQNVIWTFLLGLVAIWLLEQLHKNLSALASYLVGAFVLTTFAWLAEWLSTDYSYRGLLVILAFHIFRGMSPQQKTKQLIALLIVSLFLSNIDTLIIIGGWKNIPMYWEHYGFQLISPQLFAPLALPIIWSYNNQAGPTSKKIQTFNYLFYPIHMLILGLLSLNLM